MISISHLKECRLKYESYALGARIYMSGAIELKELEPGVYGVPPKREPVLSPGWLGRVAWLAIFLTLSQLTIGGIDYVLNAAVLGVTGKSLYSWEHRISEPPIQGTSMEPHYAIEI